MGFGVKIIEEIIIRYPETKMKAKTKRNTKTTASYNFHSGGRSSGRRDPTADAALQELYKDEIEELVAVQYAIKQTYRYEDGVDRMRAMLLLYWKHPRLNVEETAKEMNLPIYYLNMYRQDFIYAVAQKLELTPCAGCVFWREYLPGYNGCHYTYDMGHCRIRAIDRSCLSKSTELETLERAWWWNNNSVVAQAMERKRAYEQEKKAASL